MTNTFGWCELGKHELCYTHVNFPTALTCACGCHTAADECRDEFRDDVERELREYGVELP